MAQLDRHKAHEVRFYRVADLNTDKMRELIVRCMNRLKSAGRVHDIRCLRMVEKAAEFERNETTLREVVIAAGLVELYGKCRFKIAPSRLFTACREEFGGDACVWRYARLFSWESLRDSARIYKIDMPEELDLRMTELKTSTLPSWGRTYDVVSGVMDLAHSAVGQIESVAQGRDIAELGAARAAHS